MVRRHSLILACACVYTLIGHCTLARATFVPPGDMMFIFQVSELQPRHLGLCCYSYTQFRLFVPALLMSPMYN